MGGAEMSYVRDIKMTFPVRSNAMSDFEWIKLNI